MIQRPYRFRNMTFMPIRSPGGPADGENSLSGKGRFQWRTSSDVALGHITPARFRPVLPAAPKLCAPPSAFMQYLLFEPCEPAFGFGGFAPTRPRMLNLRPAFASVLLTRKRLAATQFLCLHNHRATCGTELRRLADRLPGSFSRATCQSSERSMGASRRWSCGAGLCPMLALQVQESAMRRRSGTCSRHPAPSYHA